MRTRWLWASLLAIALVLLVGASLALARGRLLAPEGAPAAAPLEDAFTYQGELIRGTAPVSETCEMAFRLYDASSGGLQAGEPITTSVQVVDGLFTAPLDFGTSAFAGEARWLGIAVKCPGDPLWAAFPERQALTAAPYALYAKAAGAAESAPWGGLTGVPAGFADGTDDVDDADADPGNELNSAMALVGNTLVLTDTGTVSADLSGLTVRQLVQDFVLHSGESVSAGDLVTWMDGEAYGPAPRWGGESVFTTGYAHEIDLAALSETGFVIVYREAGTDYGVAITGTVSGGSVTWGSPSVFHPAATYVMSVEALSGTEFVVAYADGGNANYGTAIAGTLTDGDFFWDTASIFNAASTHNISLATLSGTELVIAYGDGGNANYGTAIAGTLTGGSLVWGSESVFNADTTYEVNVVALSGTEVVVVFRDFNNASLGTAIVGTVSGGAFAWGSPSVFNPAETVDVDAAALSGTDLVVVYRDGGNLEHGTAIIGTVSGGELTWGDASVFNPGPAAAINVAALPEAGLVVCYREADDFEYGMAVTGELSGNGLIWSREGVFNPGRTIATGVAALPASGFVVIYSDNGNADLGTARVPDRMERRPIGTAKHAAAGGETVTVVVEGVSEVHTGLIPGQVYYWQDDGSLGTTHSRIRVGLAISDAELLLDQLWPQ
jgi:hypothetical protein